MGVDGNILCLVLGNGTWVYTIVKMHQTEHLRPMHVVSLLIILELFLIALKKIHDKPLTKAIV